MGGDDVTHRLVAGSLTWETAIGRSPTASFTLHDSEDPVGGLPATTAVAYQGTYVAPVVKVTLEGDTHFLGPVSNFDRQNPHEGIQTQVQAEGWQTLMSECPCWPNYWTRPTVVVFDPNGTDKSSYVASAASWPVFRYAAGGREAIELALKWWRGPTITLDCPDALMSVTDLWYVRGLDLASVISGILERCGGGVWWLEGLVLHVRSVPFGVGGGEATYTGPAELLADWSLDDTPGTGVLVPTTVSESNSFQRPITGVYADGKTMWSSSYVRSDAPWGGAIATSVNSSRRAVVESYAEQSLKPAGWDKTVTVTIPPLAPGDPKPEVGVVVHLSYMGAWNGYYLVRGVTARTVVTGSTIEVAEWTLDLGSAPPRSYVREAPEEIDKQKEEQQDPVIAKQVVRVEVSPVDQKMGKDSRQYIYAWTVNGEGNRVAMDSGTVDWSILTEDDTDIGIGSVEAGWLLTGPASSSVVYTDDQPLGFAYTELTCYDTDLHPMVRVQATMSGLDA